MPSLEGFVLPFEPEDPRYHHLQLGLRGLTPGGRAGWQLWRFGKVHEMELLFEG